jgi:hypothetical protein
VADGDDEVRSDEEGRRDSDGAHGDDYLDEQEEESFPASDPHSDWSG